MSTKRNLDTTIVSAKCSMGTSYKQFENIPEDMRITANTERWTTIWVAKEPKTHKFLLKKYHAVGEKSWPFGGYTLWDTKAEQDYHCYFDCAVIHPENFKRQKKKTAKKKASRIVKKTTKKTAKKKVSRK